MTDEGKLVKLSDSDLRVAGGSDIRDRTVKNPDGEEVGTVEDLLIDPEADEVRFLIVASGGFLGIGKEKSFVPVEAVREVGDEVLVDLSREQLAGAPGYDPDLVPDRVYYDQLYGYYGFTPYWVSGFTPPFRPWP
ncbi:PRC-barrel domain-containing protein [Lysobacter korlensis]|uniref:PRC-barrel domain-containing protein n=1 Tax=Lysobacter korlensis TaxID=553636 RepID=A0ABV6RR56_9GAMM